MTIYHRLKVWAIKGWRFFRYGFKQVRARRDMAIFTGRIQDDCDYCGAIMVPVVVLEAEYEVFPRICANCLDRCFKVLYPIDGFQRVVHDLYTKERAENVIPQYPQSSPKDPRGVVQ